MGVTLISRELQVREYVPMRNRMLESVIMGNDESSLNIEMLNIEKWMLKIIKMLKYWGAHRLEAA